MRSRRSQGSGRVLLGREMGTAGRGGVQVLGYQGVKSGQSTRTVGCRERAEDRRLLGEGVTLRPGDSFTDVQV